MLFDWFSVLQLAQILLEIEHTAILLRFSMKKRFDF